jgi:exodeoxyribonuclease X
MLKREGFNSHYRLVDTFRVLKQLYPEGRYGLQYNRYYFQLYKREEELLARLKEKGLELELRPHSALADTLVLYLLVEHLVREGHSIEEMIELTQKPIIYEKFYWGKHKYRPIAEVIVEDPEYIETLLEDENLEEDWRVSIQYHLERVEAKPVYRFQLGKYRGMTPEDVARIDWDYLKWAYHNLGGLSRGFRERIAEILKEGKPPADPYLEEEV